MDTITNTIDLAAPPAQVWAALTEPDQLLRWLAPNLPWAKMQHDASGKISLDLGGGGVDLMQFDVVEPLRAAQWRGLPDDRLTVNYSLAEAGGGTRLTVALAGFERLPAEARADRQALSSAAWEQTLQNFNAHLTGAALPFPTAFVGPLFGYWREPQQQVALERSIWIKATPARVWQAIVDPAQFQAWFSPATPWVLSELAVGGRLYTIDPETKAEQYISIIELLDPPTQLVLRHLPHAYLETEKRTDYTLTEENGGTRLTILYSGYERDAAETRGTGMEQSTFGYGMMFQNIKAYVEGQPLPFPGGF